MNAWLLGAAALLGLIGLVHSVMGEQRIFLPWAARPPAGMPRIHRQILRGSWHLVTLLGLGQVGALVWLGLAAAADRPSPGLELALLACLAGGVLASGVLVMGITRGRHQGGAALVVVALLIGGGIAQAAAR